MLNKCFLGTTTCIVMSLVGSNPQTHTIVCSLSRKGKINYYAANK